MNWAMNWNGIGTLFEGSAAPSRRAVLGGAAAVTLAGVLPTRALAQATGKVVVVGGGFGGATCARHLRALAPNLSVTLVEPDETIVTCPFSNTVIAGLNGIDAITRGLAPLKSLGVTVAVDRAAGFDPSRRVVKLSGGQELPYDRLVLSPGVDLKWGAIEGYDEKAAEIMPHAWKAGPQTLLLRRQIEAMDDGGVVVISAPQNPYRCPPGPYERASLIAHYLKAKKPRSKVIVLDAKDNFSKQGLFVEAWKKLYPGLLEWVPFAQAGNLTRVDPSTKTFHTDFSDVKADVANVIPPQRASRIVDQLGLAKGEDWVRVNQSTFESAIVPGVHVLGDSIIAGAMPKSAFSATSQAKMCAHAIAALMAGREPPVASFINTCYSLVAPDYGITVSDVFRVAPNGSITAVEGAGGVSPLGAPPEFRAREADYARGWYASITAETFG
ncbi:NAD(P)/FAD-dependent oxidoreductase [Alsobacter sp. SYSU M60028]|uniref:NAD(P)/FAD-dependent oxidoreductase n=1 Tax=Alsobacter ponti TaxID=2962936 RepID=A0ABT1LHI5_9HYPH|nr:NAD(P)/FAD-dependent oxidoreductase [Alsobacter ponti]MCP8940965.1 NAD(P)/FAD-dependent oxidoreductase [Alsobacter ponti]